MTTLLFFSVLQNVFDQKPKTRYIVAVDDSQVTLEEIVRVGGAGRVGMRGWEMF